MMRKALILFLILFLYSNISFSQNFRGAGDLFNRILMLRIEEQNRRRAEQERWEKQQELLKQEREYEAEQNRLERERRAEQNRLERERRERETEQEFIKNNTKPYFINEQRYGTILSEEYVKRYVIPINKAKPGVASDKGYTQVDEEFYNKTDNGGNEEYTEQDFANEQPSNVESYVTPHARIISEKDVIFDVPRVRNISEEDMDFPDEYLGNFSKNPYGYNSTSNRYGKYGSPYSSDSINNIYGKYGSPYSSNSVNNPYATDTPKLYDSQGNYRGKLSTNPYDPESISNKYGRYGSKYSSESIKKPYGAGSKYKSDSPNNPYGTGWKIIMPDE